MEWRIFLPAEEGCPDVWKLLGQSQISRYLLNRSQVRRDVYLSCTQAVGWKIRGGQDLMEIKVRGSRTSSGAEEWYKVMQQVDWVGNEGSLASTQLLHKHAKSDNSKDKMRLAFVRELEALLKSSRSSLGKDITMYFFIQL